MKIDPKKTALLLMDMQDDILGRVPETGAAVVSRAQTVLAAARKAQMQVMHVVVGFRPGYPEISPKNASFGVVRATGRFVITTPGADIVSALRPEADEPIVVKRRVSAFAGSDLEVLLRAKGIDTLVLAGIATSGVVLSTLRQAADADYGLVVVKDCCADGDEEVHRVLTEKIFPRQAQVVTATEAIAAFE